MREVEVDAPVEVIALEDVARQFEFNTTVDHRTDIDRHRTSQDTGRHRCRLVVEQIGSLAVEIFKRTAQAAFEEFEVNTDVESLALLPCEFFVAFVGQRLGIFIRFVGIRNRVAVGVGVVNAIAFFIKDSVVTLHTPAGFELQSVEP